MRLTSFVEFIEEFYERGTCYLVFQLCSGGTLKTYLKELKVIIEEECLRIVYEVGLSILYLHQEGITHRDIKPANILIHEGSFKISDFGLANDEISMETYCGTTPYMAPEIINTNYTTYDKKVDVWALTVLFFRMISGKLPFYSRTNKKKMVNKILTKPFRIKKKYDSLWSTSLKKLLKKGLKKTPRERLSI